MKKSKNIKRWVKVKIAVLVTVITLVIFVGGVFMVAKVRYYNDAANLAGIVPMRELILSAVRGLKKDAPVEPRTGDVYFPESRLYLPNPGMALGLTYLFDKGGISGPEEGLTISTYPVRGTQALYTAQDMKELFTAVPKLQACSRGVKLYHNKLPQDNTSDELRHTVHLNNGRDVYIYLDKDCPELSQLADLMKNIRAY
jgi:hypothetical protein